MMDKTFIISLALAMILLLQYVSCRNAYSTTAYPPNNLLQSSPGRRPTSFIREPDVAAAGQLIEAAAADEGARQGRDELSYIYYVRSCPRAYDIIHEHVQGFIRDDPSNAAGILRLFFLDCFIQGCDASLLLFPRRLPPTDDDSIGGEGSAGASGGASRSRHYAPYYALRRSAIHMIDGIKESLEMACPGVVSCADILALAARDAVFMVGGPWIPMLSGRRDSSGSGRSRISRGHEATEIPLPTQGFPALKQLFQARGLDVRDLVALSGGHTIGHTHCRVVAECTENHNPDRHSGGDYLSSDPFAENLRRTCCSSSSSSSNQSGHMTVELDGFTPDVFDNAYFKNIMAKRAIFHSDASLVDDAEARAYVHLFARDEAEFFKQFSASFGKLSRLGVLTAGPATNYSDPLRGVTAPNSGEIRMRCSVPN